MAGRRNAELQTGSQNIGEQLEGRGKGFCGSEKLGSQAEREGPAQQWGREEGVSIRSGRRGLDSVLVASGLGMVLQQRVNLSISRDRE